MDRKLIMICVLSVTALAMAILNFSTPSSKADFAIGGRDYQVVTARVQTGGEGVYILENRSGLMAVYTYDPSSQSLLPQTVRPVTDAFRGGR
jgi:hypothetical protein